MGFMKRIVSLPYVNLKAEEKSQTAHLPRICRIDFENIIINGKKYRVHRVYVNSSDSADYQHLGWIINEDMSETLVHTFKLYMYLSRNQSHTHTHTNTHTPHTHQSIA
jgi:hypothetical protein